MCSSCSSFLLHFCLFVVLFEVAFVIVFLMLRDNLKMKCIVFSACCSVWIAGWLGSRTSPFNCFLNPPNTLSNYVSFVLYTYDLHHNFVRSPTIEKFNPPADFSQFRHWLAETY